MSYFKDQQDTWFDGGILWYAEENGINLDKLNKQTKTDYDFAKKIYQELKLEFGSIPADYDPYCYLAERL